MRIAATEALHGAIATRITTNVAGGNGLNGCGASVSRIGARLARRFHVTIDVIGVDGVLGTMVHALFVADLIVLGV